MVKQTCIEREKKKRDEGTCGFHDYVTEYEPLDNFITRVTEAANSLKGRVKNIQYVNGGTDNEILYAVILYEAKTEKFITQKQQKRVSEILSCFGEETVKNYITLFFPEADVKCLTREQAQKIITGLSPKMDTPVIYGVCGRDYNETKG